MQERFQYPADIQQIPFIRKDLSLLTDQWKIPRSTFSQISYIVEELFSNIVRYAYQDQGRHLVELEFKREPEAIMIVISDDGIPFDPLQYKNTPLRDPAAPESGGMGLSLVRTFADSIVYRRSGEKNQLEITKRIKSAEK